MSSLSWLYSVEGEIPATGKTIVDSYKDCAKKDDDKLELSWTKPGSQLVFYFQMALEFE